ncbi:MAG TPA: DUF4389 domain-containing protein [Vicinamibacterales bacterium]|nr:DUF4389 domain-containing protein [Vicinamibacterales bacterium]
MPYPVVVTIEPQYRDRDRLTVGLRLLLAIPHMIFVGTVGLSFAARNGARDFTSVGGETGLLGGVAWLLAVVSWFTIVISGVHINVVRRYTRFYLRWRVRALAYMMLLVDGYPPFGDGPYPVALTLVETEARDRLSVGLRILLAIPHFIVLFFLVCAWWVTSLVSWLLILFTGEYPQGLYNFGAAVLRWLIRVEAYVLLMVDEYPPFAFE